MRPGDTVIRCFKVLDPAGAVVAGLTLSDFAAVGIANAYGAAAFTDIATPGFAIAAIAGHSGWYRMSHAFPPSAGFCGIDIVPTNPLYRVVMPSWSGEIENQDLDRLYAAVAKPVVTLASAGSIGQQVALTLVTKRYCLLEFAFVDSAGAKIDMTSGVTYTNFAWSVRAYPDQTASPPKFDKTTGIVGSDGLVQVPVLESSSFFSYLTEGASAADSVTVRHELTADLVAVANETVALVPSSALIITRREVGS
jgi:hypothetical protein